jgi:uncharacterized protein YqgV (UPF0045/DUF77 family)
MIQKELNPHLFLETPIERSLERQKISEDTRLMSQEQLIHLINSASPYTSLNNAVHVLDIKFNDMKTQLNHLQDEMNKFVAQVNEFAKTSQIKVERVTHAMTKTDITVHNLETEVQQKHTVLSNKMAERRTLDLKIQEMVDRHNNILRTFEVRMSQMQKVIADKEAQLLQSQSALNEAKMEIARLKRI